MANFGYFEFVFDEPLLTLELGKFVIAVRTLAARCIDCRCHRWIGFSNHHPRVVGVAQQVGEVGNRTSGDTKFDGNGGRRWAGANPKFADVRIGIELFGSTSSGEPVVHRRVVRMPVRRHHQHRVGNGVRSPSRVVRESRVRAIRVVGVVRANQDRTSWENEGVSREFAGQFRATRRAERHLFAFDSGCCGSLGPIARNVVVKRRIHGCGCAISVARLGVVTHANSLPRRETMLAV